jgi:uncharacterized protein DUF3558
MPTPTRRASMRLQTRYLAGHNYPAFSKQLTSQLATTNALATKVADLAERVITYTSRRNRLTTMTLVALTLGTLAGLIVNVLTGTDVVTNRLTGTQSSGSVIHDSFRPGAQPVDLLRFYDYAEDPCSAISSDRLPAFFDYLPGPGKRDFTSHGPACTWSAVTPDRQTNTVTIRFLAGYDGLPDLESARRRGEFVGNTSKTFVGDYPGLYIDMIDRPGPGHCGLAVALTDSSLLYVHVGGEAPDADSCRKADSVAIVAVAKIARA